MNAHSLKRSPRIIHLAWGEIEAEGLARARDLKLWPGSGRPWDWRETGTHHVPGIQVGDVQELLENGAGDRNSQPHSAASEMTASARASFEAWLVELPLPRRISDRWPFEKSVSR
jgi:hypothetical protein